MTTNSRIQAIERTTGRSWDEWLVYLEGIDAKNLTHHQIASELLKQLDGVVDNIGWWAQSIAVAYEQQAGRRVPGQRPDGTFQTSVSKATKSGMQDLMDAWTGFAADDEDVVRLVDGDVRVSGTENRITWRAKAVDGSAIVVISEPKKNGTASLVVQQMGLQTHELNLEAKERWAAIVNRFVAGLPGRKL